MEKYLEVSFTNEGLADSSPIGGSKGTRLKGEERDLDLIRKKSGKMSPYKPKHADVDFHWEKTPAESANQCFHIHMLGYVIFSLLFKRIILRS